MCKGAARNLQAARRKPKQPDQHMTDAAALPLPMSIHKRADTLAAPMALSLTSDDGKSRREDERQDAQRAKCLQHITAESGTAQHTSSYAGANSSYLINRTLCAVLS